jgi:hypothetical protein
MTTSELHTRLKEAYSNHNLNKITVTLINLYKEQQFGTLRHIAEMISESVEIEIEEQGKFFSRLMMLYHPDRGNFHRNEMDKLAANEDHDGLLGYSHILMLGRIEEIAATLTSFEDIDYSPVYDWDINLDGFTIVNTGEPENSGQKDGRKRSHKGYTFYDAVKMRMYGKTTVGFPTHYLEDMDEFELSQSGINDLDGVQYCIHAVSMDLSGNDISDISLLWGLLLLEDLNLADNKIEELETLVNLKNLRTLNLSNNVIRDVSYLADLRNLEYVDLTGTRVSSWQIRELEESGITVVAERNEK